MATDQLTRDVRFVSDEVTLAGTLTTPDCDGPVPGVVMVGGSGPSDRDNDTYFPPIRRTLVEAGIAVLSYDKRGVGASSGDWRAAALADLAADAAAALDVLRATPGVRAEATGLFGHSEGGWVVLRAAALADAPWVVTNSCPGMSPAVQDRYALANIARQKTDDADAVLATYDRLVEAGRRDADHTEAAELVRTAAIPQEFRDLLNEHWTGQDKRLWEFTKRKQDHDPIPDVLRLHCPHLALFGAADDRVPIADSIHLFATAACHPDRDPRATLTVEVFPHANHRIQTAGAPTPGYLETLTRWITARTAS